MTFPQREPRGIYPESLKSFTVSFSDFASRWFQFLEYRNEVELKLELRGVAGYPRFGGEGRIPPPAPMTLSGDILEFGRATYPTTIATKIHRMQHRILYKCTLEKNEEPS